LKNGWSRKLKDVESKVSLAIPQPALVPEHRLCPSIDGNFGEIATTWRERASGLSGATLPEFLQSKRRRSNWRSTERVKFDDPFSRKNGQLAARELGLQLHSMEVSNADPF